MNSNALFLKTTFKPGKFITAQLRNFSASASSISNGEVLIDRIKQKLVITLNRPKALNAVNLPMIKKIYEALQEPSDLVIIKGQGLKAFCAGGDVVVSKSYQSGDKTERIYDQFFRHEYRLNHLIGTLKKPYIALINGITMGGGCGLSINGPFRVATERTVLAMPETALGLFPDVGATHFLPRLPGHLGMFLGLTGYRLYGSDVFHSGLATHYVESCDITRLSTDLISLPADQCTNYNVNSIIKKFQPQNIASFSLDPYLDLIDECFDANSVEEIMEKLNKKVLKKEEGSDFALEQLEALEKMVFPIEFRLSQRFIFDHDFHEGCRAILIDKDKNPKWQPSTLKEVSESKIEYYFSKFDEVGKELIV
ncbi:unnamed protein product [Meloidogyne enterolobii]|uniref:Uncharacterized protein n=1 Tax=Meloidogyne enterolobii TaxID=390850 RepID=A0ACB0ZH26_MELEN